MALAGEAAGMSTPGQPGALRDDRVDQERIPPDDPAYPRMPAPQRRVQTLIDAILTVGTDLDLSQVLERVVHSACVLAGARYGVLILATPEREITDTITFGTTAEDRAKISQLPELREVPGWDFKPGREIRIAEVPEHFTAAGLPRPHPAVPDLLGVPIAMRDETFGHLYLGDCGHDGDDDTTSLTPDDEEALLALATAAGIAIQNARLFERERRRQQWLQAASEMTHLLLGEVNRDQALRMVTRQLREISGACYGSLILLDPAVPGTMVLEAADGLGLEFTTGTRTDIRGIPAMVMESGKALVTRDLPAEKAFNPPPDWRKPLSVVGLGMVLPLVANDEILGVLYVGWERNSPNERLAAQEVPLVEMWASHAALALQRVQAQRNNSRLLILEDRDRIARDLHDAVIQRLFAVGTRLHSANGLSTRPEVQRRIARAIEELDETTNDIRSTIFQLHEPRRESPTPLQNQLLAELDMARDLFGFTPRVVLNGLVDSLPEAFHDELIFAVRHALTVAGKRRAVVHVEVVINLVGGVSLTVTDDGVAGDSQTERFRAARIAELSAQASRLGGRCETFADDDGRTTIKWCAPFD
ncbi:GAF domain-containing protein [Actinopolymorpha sp. B11F2]|uniref:sensor histidine kinase n=1 Tax=Actinopolymorpha sp. B11F2 TaxID=3160862 RepID=UPI0032E500AB